MESYSDFKSKQYEKLIRNLERCKRQINYMNKVDKYVHKGLVGGTGAPVVNTSREEQQGNVTSGDGAPVVDTSGTTGTTNTTPIDSAPVVDTSGEGKQGDITQVSETVTESALNYSVGDIIKSNTSDQIYVILNDKEPNEKQNVLELKNTSYVNEKEDEILVTNLNANYTKVGNVTSDESNIDKPKLDFYSAWYSGSEGLRLREEAGEEDADIQELLGDITDPKFVTDDDLKDISSLDFGSLDNLADTIKTLLANAKATASSNKSVLESQISKLERQKVLLSNKIKLMKTNKETANSNYERLKISYNKVRQQLIKANDRLGEINSKFSNISKA